jgi:predicted CopG family antitoxin
VHRELGEIGKLSERYSDVIRRLTDHYKKTMIMKGRNKEEEGEESGKPV